MTDVAQKAESAKQESDKALQAFVDGFASPPRSPVFHSPSEHGLGYEDVTFLLPVLLRRRPVGGRTHQRMPEPHPCTGLGQSRLRGWCRRLGPIPSRPAARNTSAGSPVGSAAVTSGSRAGGGSAPICRRKLSSIRPSSGSAWCAVSFAGHWIMRASASTHSWLDPLYAV